jgi:hypothetical protein
VLLLLSINVYLSVLGFEIQFGKEYASLPHGLAIAFGSSSSPSLERVTFISAFVMYGKHICVNSGVRV